MTQRPGLHTGLVGDVAWKGKRITHIYESTNKKFAIKATARHCQAELVEALMSRNTNVEQHFDKLSVTTTLGC